MKYMLLLIAAFIATSADARPAKKRPDANGNPITRCDPPKRWIEVDALADDAGRPSKRVCKAPQGTS